MAKQSVVEARKAQALVDQAEAIQQLTDQIAKLEAKIDQLIENQKPTPTKSQGKMERGTA